MALNHKSLLRRPHWRQATPRDQLVTILGAARGLADNAAEGVYTDPEVLRARMLEVDALLEQAVALSGFVNGEWPAETAS